MDLENAYQDPLLNDKKQMLGLTAMHLEAGMTMVTTHVQVVVIPLTAVTRIQDTKMKFRVLTLTFNSQRSNGKTQAKVLPGASEGSTSAPFLCTVHEGAFFEPSFRKGSVRLVKVPGES